jgi:Cysteine-rich CPCC
MGGSIDPCPCCGYWTGCRTCPICFWSQAGDGVDLGPMHDDPNQGLSLAHARLNYAIYGACHPRYRDVVRVPHDSERGASFEGGSWDGSA